MGRFLLTSGAPSDVSSWTTSDHAPTTAKEPQEPNGQLHRQRRDPAIRPFATGQPRAHLRGCCGAHRHAGRVDDRIPEARRRDDGDGDAHRAAERVGPLGRRGGEGPCGVERAQADERAAQAHLDASSDLDEWSGDLGVFFPNGRAGIRKYARPLLASMDVALQALDADTTVPEHAKFSTKLKKAHKALDALIHATGDAVHEARGGSRSSRPRRPRGSASTAATPC